jgi:hypothetical protein
MVIILASIFSIEGLRCNVFAAMPPILLPSILPSQGVAQGHTWGQDVSPLSQQPAAARWESEMPEMQILPLNRRTPTPEPGSDGSGDPLLRARSPSVPSRIRRSHSTAFPRIDSIFTAAGNNGAAAEDPRPPRSSGQSMSQVALFNFLRSRGSSLGATQMSSGMRSMLAESIMRIQHAADGRRLAPDAPLQATVHQMARSRNVEELETQWNWLFNRRLRGPSLQQDEQGESPAPYFGFGRGQFQPRSRAARSRSRGGMPPVPRPPASMCVARSDFLQTGMQFVGMQSFTAGASGPLRAWKVVIELSNVRLSTSQLQCNVHRPCYL